jgi:hypothetical protein
MCSVLLGLKVSAGLFSKRCEDDFLLFVISVTGLALHDAKWEGLL